MKKIIIVMTAFCMFLLVFSCASLQQSLEGDNNTPAPPQQIANLTFDDLPVPTAMILDRKNSFVYETSNYRTGMLYYHGNMSAIDVANFYKTEMSKYNWTLVNSLEYREGSQLIFEKPEWIVVIRCISKGENSSELIITIGPKGVENTK